MKKYKETWKMGEILNVYDSRAKNGGGLFYDEETKQAVLVWGKSLRQEYESLSRYPSGLAWELLAMAENEAEAKGWIKRKYTEYMPRTY